MLPEQCYNSDEDSGSEQKLMEMDTAEGPRDENFELAAGVKKETVECAICKKKYAFKGNLYVHMRQTHKVEPVPKSSSQFQCQYCKKRYSSKRNLNDHIGKVHQVEPVPKSSPLQCKYCEKKFTYHSRLMGHLKNHHVPDHDYGRSIKSRLICPYETCELYFPSYTLMRAHLKEDHNITLEFEHLSFGSVEEFKQWKKEYEAEKKSSYILGHNNSLVTGETRQKYYCNRSFNYVKEGIGKRLMKNIGTNKIGKACPSLIEVTRSSNMHEVKIWKTHVGHTCELGHTFLHKETRAEIADKLSQGVPFQRVLDDIRKNDKIFNSREYFTTRKDLQNICRDYKINNIHRHPDDAISINIWVNEQKERADESPVLFYKRQSDKDETNTLMDDDFVLILMTKFQSNMLKKFGHDKICIDGTHGTNAYKLQLFTLLTVDEYGSGCPVAFCFSNRSDETLFKLFFNVVKSNIGTAINANVFMSDDAPAFYNAWYATMGRVPHQLLCTWHVLRNWSSQLCKISGGQEKKKPVYNALKALHQITSIEDFNKSLTKTLEDLHSDPDTLEFAKYFEKTYSRRPELWAYCHRIHLGINTNMYLESFHKILKHIYLGGKKVKRLDDTIYALMNIARDSHFNRMTKILKKSPSDKLRRVWKSHKNSQSIEITSIQILSPGSRWLVPSQSHSTTNYIVFKTENEHTGCTISCKECNNICIHDFTCSCLDNMIKYNICKHIHACVRLSRNSGVEIKSSILSNGMDNENELNELMSAPCNYNQTSQSYETLIKKTELFLGLLQNTPFNSNFNESACKKLDKLIDEANKNSNVSFKSTENINTNAKVTKQIRLYSTQKSKLKKKNMYLKTPTCTEKNDIVESPLLNKTRKRINIHDHTYASSKSSWFHIDSFTLNNEDAKIILDDNGWLTDNIINAACTLLKNEHNVEGLQSPLLTQTSPPSFKTCNGDFIQICHVIKIHWNCITGSIKNNEIIVNVYDSLFNDINEDIVSIASSIYRDKNIENITIYVHNIEKQVNGSNCGLHAIANAKLLCLGIDPSHRKLLPDHRKHLFNTFNNKAEILHEFPSEIRTNTIRPNIFKRKTLHCKCRKPSDGKMFTCNKCLEQFHERCVEDYNNDYKFYCTFCNDKPPVSIEIS